MNRGYGVDYCGEFPSGQIHTGDIIPAPLFQSNDSGPFNIRLSIRIRESQFSGDTVDFKNPVRIFYSDWSICITENF